MSEKGFSGRLALVTGATAGLGRAVSLALASKGAHVIAVGRKKQGLEALDDEIQALGGEATLVPLDLTKGAGIDELGGVIFERWKKLDILVGNAGILGPMSPLSHVPPKQWQEVIDINLTANFRLIRSMDALLRASEAGRAVFITSNITQGSRAYWGPYATSKAALEMLVLTYAAETRQSTLKVNLVNPGAMRTSMRAKAYPGEDPKTLATPEQIAPKILPLLRPEFDQTGQRFDVADM